MELSGLNIIGYEYSGTGTKTFRAASPSGSGELDPEIREAEQAEVDRAVHKAADAALIYRRKTNEERAQFLEAIADEILALGDGLIRRCMDETALPEVRLTGERGRTMNQLRLFASVVRDGSWVDARIDTADPDRQPLPKPDIRQMHIPLGPVGIFGASNFPLAFSVAGGDTASALAAGCPVVFKGHPLHPGTSEMVGSAIIKAAKRTNMPDGVFSLVQGMSNDVGMALVKHPKITAIGFTGSFNGGKAIFDTATQRSVPIPVFAEMGSSNPVFVLPGALKDRWSEIAKGLCASLNMGVGQFCTTPGLIFTPKTPEAERLVGEMSDIISGGPNGIMLGDGIRKNFLAGVKRLTGHQGVTLAGSGRETEDGNLVQTRIFTTDASVFIDDESMDEEIFGPATLHIHTSGKSEILRAASALSGHLTATIHGNEDDLLNYADLISILEEKAGRIIFNGYPTGVEVCHSMVHGGPFPATTAPQTTSVGTAAIRRFARPVCYQDFPQSSLPNQLRDENPLKLWRLVNGQMTQKALS